MGKKLIEKRIGFAILALCILLVVNRVYGFFIAPLLFSSDIGSGFWVRSHLVSGGYFVISILGNVVVAIWLNLEAKRLHRKRFIWTIFGLFFGIVAALLFYVIEIYNEIILLRQNIKKISR